MNLSELNGLSKELLNMRKELDELKKTKTAKEKEYDRLSKILISILEENEMTSLDNEYAKFTIRNIPYAKVCDKEALANHLKKQNLFDDYYSFNSQRMNSYYKERLEAAIESGADDFDIDGMEMTSNRQTITVKEKK